MGGRPRRLTKPDIIWATWGARSGFRSLIGSLLVLVAVVYVRHVCFQPSVTNRTLLQTNYTRTDDGCNLFSGRWVFDNVSYPLYEEQRCMYMSDEVACEKFGRKDLKYQYWRWRPHGCDLPRFNATSLLERLRNKRLVYVGDSLNRGQWVSMICLVESSIPPAFKSLSYHNNHSLITFHALEYNATIEFYWSPMLVESNCDHPHNHLTPDRIVRVEAIEKHARHWSSADILVFNSYLWWLRPQMKVLWGSFGSPIGIYKMVRMARVYEMALNTWSDWLEVHISRSKTQVFFVTMSPIHDRAADWGSVGGHNCFGEREPITQQGYSGSGSKPEMMQVVKEVMDRLRARGVNVQILNVTQLSEYRKEAHPSIHRRQWHPLTEEQIANPVSYADCFHWCLPGVPDIWNELLYAYISRNSNPNPYGNAV